MFKDLTLNHRYYLTNGMKFGANLLAYEGDPLTIHSTYLIKILESNEVPLNDLLVYERMANSNRKKLLLAYEK